MNDEIKCNVCGNRNRVSVDDVNTIRQCESCASEYLVPITNITPGLVQGDYWIQRKVGSGNISETFVAKRVSDSSKVFLKVLNTSLTTQPQCVNNFMIEMCRSHQVDNKHIVSAFETGKLHGHYYIATPYVEGECLDQLVENNGPLAEKDVLKIALKSARLLRQCWQDYALVHRSMRPSNILVTGTGDVYLLDVGNSKRYLAPLPTPLDKLNFQGTVADYLSPEQAEGITNLDCTSDIYSLGATMFYLLTGKKPYLGEDTTQVLEKHLCSSAPDASRHSEAVSKETARLIRKMMAKDPTERIRSWHSIIKQLKGILKTMTQGVGTSDSLKTQLRPKTTIPLTETTRIARPKNRGIRVMVGVAAAALAALFIVSAGTILFINRDTTAPTDQNSPHQEAAVQVPEKRIHPDAFSGRIKRILEMAQKKPKWRRQCMKRLNELRQQTDDPGQIKEIETATALVRHYLTPSEAASSPRVP